MSDGSVMVINSYFEYTYHPWFNQCSKDLGKSLGFFLLKNFFFTNISCIFAKVEIHNTMGKILDSDFRKELYKNLVEAGYEKVEAQKIVGKKYYVELLENLKQGVDAFLSSLVKEDFTETLDCESIASKVDELKKLKELLS
jgi:hypothetical protein